jgi:hypothetical protein
VKRGTVSLAVAVRVHPVFIIFPFVHAQSVFLGLAIVNLRLIVDPIVYMPDDG